MSTHSDAALQESSDSDDDSVPSAQGADDHEELDDAKERANKRCKLTEGVAAIAQQVKMLQVTSHMHTPDMLLHAAFSLGIPFAAFLFKYAVASCW